MATTPNAAGLVAAEKVAREQLTAISTWMINYNNEISDEQMATFMKEVVTAYLNATT